MNKPFGTLGPGGALVGIVALAGSGGGEEGCDRLGKEGGFAFAVFGSIDGVTETGGGGGGGGRARERSGN